MKKLLLLPLLLFGCTPEQEKECDCVVDTLNSEMQVINTNNTNPENCDLYSPNTVIVNGFGRMVRYREDCQ